jgi:hypothetical protein
MLPAEKRAELFAPDPLRDERLERFARLRVIGVPKEAAAEQAGFRTRDGRPLRQGNIARIDRRADVRARIAYLAHDDVEVTKEVRQFVRERLMKVANFDILKQFGIVETYERGGKKLGKLVGIDWAALQASELSIAVRSFKFDSKTGELTDFDRDDPMNAVAQLRDMHGLRSVTKIAPTNPEGTKEFVGASPSLPPREVGLAVAELLATAERELKMVPDGAASIEARAKAIAARNGILPPALYAAACAAVPAPDENP